MAIWSEDERTAIFLMATEYDLSWEQIHDIFGRMFTLGANRRYAVAVIRDEYTQRFAKGRSKMWQVIDTRGAPLSPAQQQRVVRVRQAIITVAALTGGQNFLTGRPNQAIPLLPRQPAANAGNAPAFSSNITSINASHFSRAATAGGAENPTTGTGREAENGEAEDVAEEDIDEDTVLPRRELSAGGEDRPLNIVRPSTGGKRVLGSQQTQRAPQPMVEVMEKDECQPLRMIHRSEVTEGPQGGVWDINGSVGAVDQDSAMYAFGGAARRIRSTTDQTFHVMICPGSFCSFCCSDISDQGADRVKRARQSENNPSLADKEDSEYRGKPFVHLLRDTKQQDDFHVFFPRGAWKAPTHETDEMEIVFDDHQLTVHGRSGQVGFREASVCETYRCGLCIDWSLQNSPSLVMIHSWEVDTGAINPVWRQDTSVGIVGEKTRLKQYGGGVIRLVVQYGENKLTADMMLCHEAVCSYCKSAPHGDATSDTVRRAALDAANNSNIDIGASPYRLAGENHGRPFVHAARDTQLTFLGREFSPKAPHNTNVPGIKPAQVLFDDTQLGSKNGRKDSRGLREAVICDFDQCKACQEWFAAHPGERP
ncbi:Hypothetical predicted protein [Lecanosticta acicola]|uniref:Uncharacterized protein n=1 Tax=Lecanosticta acicola TaxID=111012 RepID=A0AAI8Z8Y8_9PEZI|nr:Hypothetical predicted protein [Lecanosticta acicola]